MEIYLCFCVYFVLIIDKLLFLHLKLFSQCVPKINNISTTASFESKTLLGLFG